MKDLKRFGLAAIAALGLMAFMGAGTASATTLATDAAGTVKYAAGTELHATLKTGTSATLEKTNGELIATCTGSTVIGKIETATGTWVGGRMPALEFTGCSQGTNPIIQEVIVDGGGVITNYFGSLEIMQTVGDAGTVVGKGSEVTLNVFGVSCTYGTGIGAGTTLGTIIGGAAPELAINAVLPRTAGNGIICPNSGRWKANYIITSPHEVHVVA